MDQSAGIGMPKKYIGVLKKSKEMGFTMSADAHVGILLRTLVASKPKGRFLELGTGTGSSLSWLLDGMDGESRLISIDNDPELTAITKAYFGDDDRLQLLCEEGSEWIHANRNQKFDLVFADAWPGKYSEVEIVLDMIKPGGFYVIDDMMEQPNWPKGHAEHVQGLEEMLENREDFVVTKMNWSTGVIIAVKN